MSILDSLDLDNVADLSAVEPGEYELRILDAEEYTGKTSGKTSIRVICGIENELAANNIFHYLSLPNAGDDVKVSEGKKRRIKLFKQALGVASNDFSDWEGLCFWAELSQEADQNGEMRNNVKRLIIPA